MGIFTDLIEASAGRIAEVVNSQLVNWVLAVSASLDQSSQSPFQNVADLAAMKALDVSSWLDGTHCWVRSVDRAFVLKTTLQPPDPNLDTYPSLAAGRIWMGP